MPELPEYLTEQTEDTIRQRMLDALPDDVNKTEGDYIWDSLDPVAIELALAAIWAQEVLRRGFASTTFGSYLDLRCEEHGITRKAAGKATGTAVKGNPLTITGSAGTVVPKGSLRVATPADAVTNTPSVEFVTTADCTIGPGGSVYVDIEASAAGTGGNVPAGAISIVVTPLPGVTGVTNAAAITGGIETEDDISLLGRYLAKVRNPSAGGNKADYITWAGEVAGVGGVSVVPVKYGNGTVSVAIIDTNKQPAGQDLIDQVQNYIAPPWEHDVEAEDMTVGGSGTSVDNTQVDDSGDSVKMEYNAAGEGTVVYPGVHALLDKPGIWQTRIKVKASDIAGAVDLLRFGIWNTTTGAWAKVSSALGAADAVTTNQANDLSLIFGNLIQQFYWNGSDGLELRITRLQTDTTTTVWVDLVKFRSTFSTDTGDGKAPVGAAVFVEPATALLISVSATLTIAEGYNTESVKAAAVVNVESYIKSLAFAVDNDVRYVRIGTAILDTPGVQDYSGLLINGGAANITIGIQEVAVPGTITFL